MAKWTSNNSTTGLGSMEYGLLQSEHCSFHKVAEHLPLETNKASKMQRLERFLRNPSVVVPEKYTKIAGSSGLSVGMKIAIAFPDDSQYFLTVSTWIKYLSGRWEHIVELKASEGTPSYYQDQGT